MIHIYLAGAIRDNHPEDIEWREQAITVIQPHPVVVLNPLGGRFFDPISKLWTLKDGHQDDARMIVKQDFWAIDHSDLVIFNFNALAEGYPNIGTLVEFGRACGRSILIYSIVPKHYTGHENTAMYRLHPFLEQNSACLFHGLEECLNFLKYHIPVLTGCTPRYDATRSYDNLSDWVSAKSTRSTGGGCSAGAGI